jgi:hypothetical protein
LNWQAYDLRLYAHLSGPPIFEGPSWQWHWRYMLTSENALLFVLALIGIVLALKKRWVGLILVTLPVLHWLSMNGQALRYLRTWLPASPFACLFAALTVVTLAEWLGSRIKRLHGQAGRIAAILSLVVIGPLLMESLAVDVRLTQPDVRDLALAWSEQNLPAGTKVAVDLFGPALSPERWNLTRVTDLTQNTLDWYRAEQLDYLVLSEIMSTNPNRTVISEQRLQLLQAACTPLQEFSGPVLGRPPARIWIYEVAHCKEN